LKKLYLNVLMLFIMISVIVLSLSMLSPCFQKKFLNEKNLYEYVIEKNDL